MAARLCAAHKLSISVGGIKACRRPLSKARSYVPVVVGLQRMRERQKGDMEKGWGAAGGGSTCGSPRSRQSGWGGRRAAPLRRLPVR